jgi:hypothetical protein
MYIHIFARSCASRDPTCSLKNFALNGAIGMVTTSAEDGRVTVILVVAHSDLFKAHPRGVKVKVSNCKELSPSEKAAIDPMTIVQAYVKYEQAMENHPDPARAEAHRRMNKQRRDNPAKFKATLEARKSHPNFQAMLAKKTKEERDRLEEFHDFLASAVPGDLQALWDMAIPRNACVEAPNAAASSLQIGQRVVTVGLSSQWLNGATCSVASSLDTTTGRHLVRVHAPPEVVRRSKGAVRLKPENLETTAWTRPRVDPTAQWLDEYGWVCSKSIDYGVQCPKSHDLSPMEGCSARSGMCSVCDESDAQDIWSCCGGCCYSVCAPCRTLFQKQRGTNLRPLEDATDHSNDFPMLVCGQYGHYTCGISLLSVV